MTVSVFGQPLVKNPPAMWETWVRSLGWEDPRRRERLPTLVFWPEEFHGLSMGLQSRTQLSNFHFHFSMLLKRVEMRRQKSVYPQIKWFSCGNNFTFPGDIWQCLETFESEVAQSRPTCSNPMECNPPGFSRIPGVAEPGGLLSMGSHRGGHD